jgi:glyoxylase-like metal-dependent hydrolase (beta-lactamase superfamily II)
MKLTKSQLGPFELYSIPTGDFRLDGGAMFGVVPKTLWSRSLEADEKNRIPMTMRCLLIKSNNTGRVYLIDNGVGDKFDEKMSKIYDLDFSEHTLEQSLKAQGFDKSDITDIIFTHLHFDHCGGSTYFDEAGELHMAFPDALHHVNEHHWETAIHPNKRERASFLKENIGPLKEFDKLNLVPDNFEFEPGLSSIVVNGHTIGQQLPRIDADGKTLVFVADLLPTHVHVPLPWVMGYDMYPADTLQEKELFLEQAVEGNWYLFLEHDAYEEIMQLEKDGHKYGVSRTLTLDEL